MTELEVHIDDGDNVLASCRTFDVDQLMTLIEQARAIARKNGASGSPT